MSVIIEVPSALQKYTNDQDEVEVNAGTVQEAFNALCEQFGDLRQKKARPYGRAASRKTAAKQMDPAGGDAPDVIYSAMLSFQLTALKGQLEGAGVETAYISTDAFEATGGYFGDNIEGIYHTTHAFPTENGGRVVTLDESFTAATGSPLSG